MIYCDSNGREIVTRKAVDKILSKSENLIRVIGNVIQIGDRFKGEYAYTEGRGKGYRIVSVDDAKSILEMEKKANNGKLKITEYDYRNIYLDDIEDVDEYLEEIEECGYPNLEYCKAYYIGSSESDSECIVDFFIQLEGFIYIFTHISREGEDEGKCFCNVVYDMEMESLTDYNDDLEGVLCSIDDDNLREEARDEITSFTEDYTIYNDDLGDDNVSEEARFRLLAFIKGYTI